MKNIVLIANSTWCLYNFRYNLMKELLLRGYQVHALAPLDPTYENAAIIYELHKAGVIFHEIPLQPRGLNPFREVRTLLAIFHLLRALRPETVLSYTVKCNLYSGLCQQLLQFKQIANVPGLGEVFERRTVLSFVVSALYRLAFRGISVAFFQNHEDLRHCLDSKLVAKDRCALLPGSGVDLSRFRPRFPPLREGRRTFLMFGRLLTQKGYLEYLQAAEILSARLGERVECLVMGIEDKNRPESTELLAKLRAAERQGVIRILPARTDVVPVLDEVDVVVLPSRYNEGVPRSLLEAMAMGKAIITTDWRGCRETVEDGKNGFLVPVRDVGALAEAMMAMASMDAVVLKNMGRYSRRMVQESFDERLVLKAYLSAITGEEAFSGEEIEAETDYATERLVSNQY